MAAMDDAQVERELGALPGWERAPGGEPRIEREWRLADFASAMAFVQRVAAAAEAADHHPDILVHSWNRVRLTLSTHSQGGLTEADFRLAREIDGLV